MLAIVQSANLALRFLLELCALAALAFWGYHAGTGWVARIGLAVGAPLLAAIVWGAFVAPKATIAVPGPARLALELAVFGAAAAGLYAAGHPALAWALGLAFAINRA